MFGIDIGTFYILRPSLLVVTMMVGVMTSTLVKMMQLMNHSEPDGSKAEQNHALILFSQ